MLPALIRKVSLQPRPAYLLPLPLDSYYSRQTPLLLPSSVLCGSHLWLYFGITWRTIKNMPMEERMGRGSARSRKGGTLQNSNLTHLVGGLVISRVLKTPQMVLMYSQSWEPVSWSHFPQFSPSPNSSPSQSPSAPNSYNIETLLYHFLPLRAYLAVSTSKCVLPPCVSIYTEIMYQEVLEQRSWDQD